MKIPASNLLKRIKNDISIVELSDKLLQLGHEHEIENEIFKFELTPNRGDCFSLNGILRDLRAFYETQVHEKIYSEEIEKFKLDFLNLSTSVCPKISFVMLEVEKLPSSYQPYLEDYFNDLSINKNNFFTDISNYLSYETGQPTHVYDYEKINNKIVFKEVKSSREFKTLLGKKIDLKGSNHVFEMNDEVINLAGVVGGDSTCCSDATKKVLLECAYFEPKAIIGKSLKYDLVSDASHKFERGVDPDCHEHVIYRFIELVNQHCEIKSVAVSKHEENQLSISEIPFDADKVNNILGLSLSSDVQKNILNSLGFEVDTKIKVPSHRHDIFHLNDIAEEIARVVGYDNFPRNTLQINHTVKKSVKVENILRSYLATKGFNEVINFPFVSAFNNHSILLDNPLDVNKKYLRISIKESLIENLLYNEKRQKDSIKLFEISNVYSLKNNLVHIEKKICLIASGRLNKNYKEFSKKIDKSYFENVFKDLSDEIKINSQEILRQDVKSKLKSKIFYTEFDLSNIADLPMKNFSSIEQADDKDFNFLKVSDYPQIIRDLSFSLKNKSLIKPLQEYLFQFKSEILKDLFVFDFYENSETDKIKIGFRFVFQSDEKTLTDGDVDILMKDVINNCINIGDIQIPGL
tara:strand:- start:1058 stop:2962 length:1905 start_codon:yes stop_codon:yes gene_type:complete